VPLAQLRPGHVSQVHRLHRNRDHRHGYGGKTRNPERRTRPCRAMPGLHAPPGIEAPALPPHNSDRHCGISGRPIGESRLYATIATITTISRPATHARDPRRRGAESVGREPRDRAGVEGTGTAAASPVGGRPFRQARFLEAASPVRARNPGHGGAGPNTVSAPAASSPDSTMAASRAYATPKTPKIQSPDDRPLSPLIATTAAHTPKRPPRPIVLKTGDGVQPRPWVQSHPRRSLPPPQTAWLS
jgi:hypothetical protein